MYLHALALEFLRQFVYMNISTAELQHPTTYFKPYRLLLRLHAISLILIQITIRLKTLRLVASEFSVLNASPPKVSFHQAIQLDLDSSRMLQCSLSPAKNTTAIHAWEFLLLRIVHVCGFRLSDTPFSGSCLMSYRFFFKETPRILLQITCHHFRYRGNLLCYGYQ